MPPVSAHERITLADVARLPQIVFSATYDLRNATDAAFLGAGLQPDVAIEGAEMDAVLRFVERGLGVAVVPAMVLVEPGFRCGNAALVIHDPARALSSGR